MTLEEFKNTRFQQGMEIKYKGVSHHIHGVDFEECLIAFPINKYLPEQLTWVRCENCELIK